jgi:hypothetical protein
MSNLILVGGCSKVGKSAFIKEYSKKHNIAHGRMFDYIKRVADINGITDIDKEYPHLEIPAVVLLSDDCFSRGVLLLDLHYAVQPRFDTARAIEKECLEDFSEPYELSVSEEAIKTLTLRLNLQATCLTAPANIILSRRENYDFGAGKGARSLSLNSIENELTNESIFFEKFCGLANKFGRVDSAYIDNSGDVRQLIKEMEDGGIGIR